MNTARICNIEFLIVATQKRVYLFYFCFITGFANI